MAATGFLLRIRRIEALKGFPMRLKSSSVFALVFLALPVFCQNSPEVVALRPSPLALGPQKTMTLRIVGLPATTRWAAAITVEDSPPKIQLLRKEATGMMGRFVEIGSDHLQVESGETRLVSLPSGGTVVAFLSLPAGTDLRVTLDGREVSRLLTKQSVLIRDGVAVEKPGYGLNSFIKDFLVDFKDLPLQRQDVVRVANGEFMTATKGLKSHGISLPLPSGRAAAMDKGALPYLSFQIRIDENGKVASYQPTHGVPTAEMISAMKAWRFRPFTFDSRAVSVIATLSFQLDESGCITESTLDKNP